MGQLVGQSGEFGPLGRRGAVRGETGRQRLQLSSDLAEMAQITNVHVGGEGAPPSEGVHEPVGLQSLEGLADRGAAEAHGSRQFVVVDGCARRDVEGDEPVLQYLVRLVGERGGRRLRQGCWFGGHSSNLNDN